jgi:hypothetical protein
MITLIAPTHTRRGASSGFLQYAAILFLTFYLFFQIIDMFWEWLRGDSVGLDRNEQNWVSRELSDSIMWGNQNAYTKWEHLSIYIENLNSQLSFREDWLCIGCQVSSIRKFCFCMNCIQSMLTILRCLWFTSSFTIFSFRPWGGQGEHHKWHQLWATASCKLLALLTSVSKFDLWPSLTMPIPAAQFPPTK